MTLLEKFKLDNPNAPLCGDGTPDLCSHASKYRVGNCVRDEDGKVDCVSCWNREYIEPERTVEEAFKTAGDAIKKATATIKELNESITPRILDSGDRTQFESGAVRDMREGKGRCDLLPLDVVADIFDNAVFRFVYEFQKSGDIEWLTRTLLTCGLFSEIPDSDSCYLHTMILEVAKHFEEGAKKYGDNNWRKGIPVRCYIDSAIRHYLKYLRGDKDEPHDRAFCWNILCAIWTCKHKPELNDYAEGAIC